ncbi:MAG: DMT family transporter [Actinobacteria bacterium]|nr:DMT family transporter [Actinomycetota bacterium]
MKNDLLAIVLALSSAFLFALASVLQQRVASNIPDDEAKGGRVVLRLIRKPLWLLGGVCDTLGYFVQAAALAVGSLLIVQPLLVTTLLFALPLGLAITKRQVFASDWAFAILLTVALALFIELGDPTEGVDTAPLSAWLPSLLIIGIVTGGCLVLASARAGRTRALLLAVASGVLFGVAAALTKSVVDVFDKGMIEGVFPLVTSWETYVLAVALTVGFVAQQSAYQAGDLKEALPTLIVLEPVVAMGLGAIVLGEELTVTSALEWAVIVASLVAMLVATVQLSRSSAMHEHIAVA